MVPLRGAGVGFVGVLLAIALSGWRSWHATACVLVGAPLLAVVAKRTGRPLGPGREWRFTQSV
jgi:hypothetical protein